VSLTIKTADKLLDLIYDAATEHELWRTVLTEIADLTGSEGGILFGQSIGARQVYFDFNGRLNEECNSAYKKDHVLNPWNLGMQSQPVGRVVFSDEIVSLPSLRTTAFYDEVLRPQDVDHNAMAALAAKDGFQAAFNICRTARQGPFGSEERRILEWLMPHLRRSVRLGFRLDAYRALQQSAFDVLDRVSVGVIVLDRRQRITYLNEAARALEANGPLVFHNSSLGVLSPSHSQRLGELIRASLLGAPAGAMSLPKAGDGGILTILVSSVRGQDVARFADLDMPDAAVLVFVIDPINQNGVPADWVMDAYGLTRAEAKVALAASSGITVSEAARQLGLSQNTIKTHLRKVFAKTGTGRQSELARLIASVGLIREESTKSD